MYPYKVIIYGEFGREIYSIVEFADYAEQAKKYAIQDYYHKERFHSEIMKVRAYQL